MGIELLLVCLTLLLAAGNGANDVSKGIATLVAAGVTDHRKAAAWGSLWTVVGCLVAAFVSARLLATFSGQGLLPAAVIDSRLLAAVGAGATAWILFATRAGLPVSTTHALAGALVGAGLSAAGFSGIAWSALFQKVFLSLALGPLLALALLYVLAPCIDLLVSGLEGHCFCLKNPGLRLASGFVSVESLEDVQIAPEAACAAGGAPVLRVPALDALHWLSSGMTSFSRGLNDAPKVLALGLAASAGFGAPSLVSFLLVALAMGGGSLWAGTKVTRTLSEKVTPLSPVEGFGANLVTTTLVGSASSLGLPVSTTHCSSGAIIAAGLRRDAGSVRWDTVAGLLTAWLVTVPASGIFAAGAFWALMP